MQDRKWKEEIIAWASGADIQYKRSLSDGWEEVSNPNFETVGYFRVKPEFELIEGHWYKVSLGGTGRMGVACYTGGLFFFLTDGTAYKTDCLTVIHEMITKE